MLPNPSHRYGGWRLPLASFAGLLVLALQLDHPGPLHAQSNSPDQTQTTKPAAGAASTSAKEQALLEKIRQLKAPRWKTFGPCRYDWSAWRIAEGGVRTTPSICGSPEVTSKVAVHCETLRVSRQSSEGTWGEWRLPLSLEESKGEGAEDLMVANLCANAKPLPAAVSEPPGVPPAAKSPKPAASKAKP